MRVARLLLGAIGTLAAGYGVLRLLQLDRPDLVDAAAWLAGGVILHDAVLAPLTVAVGVLLGRVLPTRLRTAALVVLVVLGTVTVTAIPVLGSFGARPDNPTLLDRDYVGGWLVLVVLVAVGVLAGVAAGLWRVRGRGGPGSADH